MPASPTRSSLVIASIGLVTFGVMSVRAHGPGGQILGSKEDGNLGASDGSIVASGSVGLAFGLTAIACGCSMVGSLLPFLDVILPKYSKFRHFRITESKGFISGMLGIAAGVLLYLVLGDLFSEAGHNWGGSSVASGETGPLIAWGWMAGTIILLLIIKAYLAHRRANQRPKDLDSEAAGPLGVTTLPTDEKLEPRSEGNRSAQLQEEAIRVNKVHGHNPHFHKPSTVEMGRLGIEIAAALAIHNFPEGLSTFAATLVNARIGVLYGIALALHKIPEGMIMALPIYLATGSRWKAFAIASAVGVCAQMLGAVLGYVLFVTYWNSAVSGTLFAVSSGMLLVTVLSNMIPLARRYDEEDRYTSRFILAGIIFFSFVSSLFSLAD
ncbi:MAG: Zinc/iron permease [Piptocephalis tieghemiana]|nr:MAG: Zinc/iron permease [Piptocephalis tieghemiana]